MVNILSATLYITLNVNAKKHEKAGINMQKRRQVL